jgi:hypothetical protein
MSELALEYCRLFGVVKINGTSYNVEDYSDPTMLYLDNKSSISQGITNRLSQVKKLTVLTNYAVTGLDYTALTALETLTMRNGSMDDTLRTNIADRINAKTVKYLEISDWGATDFGKCVKQSNLVTVAIGGVSTISTTDAFNRCPYLTSVSFPALTSISGLYCFSNCTSLTSVSLPELTTISGTYCFYGCPLTSVFLPTLTTISKNGCFCGCPSLTSISLPALTSISGGACFAQSALLTFISLPALTTISGSYCFQDCPSLTSVSLPALTTISGYSFYNCSVLATVTFSDQIASVDSSAFSNRPDTLVNLCLVGQTDSAGDAVNGIVSSCNKLNSPPTYKLPALTSFTFSIGERIFAKTIGTGNIETLSANANLLSYVTAVLSIRHADVSMLASTPNRIFNLDSLKARINTFSPTDLNVLGVSDSLFNQYQLAGNISSRS